MDSIILHNYRCFKDLELSFKPNVNVLIGDNASGKTTVLKALTSAMGSFFTGFSDENTRFIGLEAEDFTLSKTETGLANDKPIYVQFSMFGTEGGLVRQTKKGGTLKRPLLAIAHWALGLQKDLFNENNQQVTFLPLFASFTPHVKNGNRPIHLERFIKYRHKPSFGYFEWQHASGLLEHWTRRLLVLKEGQTGAHELEGVRMAIQMALGEQGCGIIKDVHIRHIQGKVYYIFSDGREVDTENLSDGYKRLVGIVLDLAFRCLILNGEAMRTRPDGHPENAILQTKGTVLIDEIDLHLHPSLQGKILRGLRHAFPNLQFIVTTHAPMVMTGISPADDSIIYELKYSQKDDYTAREVQLYGLDASTILEVAMHTVPRSDNVDKKLSQLFGLIDDDRFPEATNLLGQMRQQFGDSLPDLARAEAMLNFLTGADNDQNK